MPSTRLSENLEQPERLSAQKGWERGNTRVQHPFCSAGSYFYTADVRLQLKRSGNLCDLGGLSKISAQASIACTHSIDASRSASSTASHCRHNGPERGTHLGAHPRPCCDSFVKSWTSLPEGQRIFQARNGTRVSCRRDLIKFPGGFCRMLRDNRIWDLQDPKGGASASRPIWAESAFKSIETRPDFEAIGPVSPVSDSDRPARCQVCAGGRNDQISFGAFVKPYPRRLTAA
ncbi:hypothetical protein BD414DRAFT_281810 [Trametes punicea]|nr:hypothetical protein BD414DRAFT_281810 [Trametes punicea]